MRREDRPDLVGFQSIGVCKDWRLTILIGVNASSYSFQSIGATKDYRRRIPTHNNVVMFQPFPINRRCHQLMT
jgi:hypothetical protein